MEPLTDEQQVEIDGLIMEGSILPALARIKTACGVSLQDARDFFRERYRQLRAERGAEFTCGDEEYWSGYGEDIFEAMGKRL